MDIIQACTALVIIFNKKKNLCGFEVLAYEQVCRLLETTLKTLREEQEVNYEFEDYPG